MLLFLIRNRVVYLYCVPCRVVINDRLDKTIYTCPLISSNPLMVFLLANHEPRYSAIVPAEARSLLPILACSIYRSTSLSG